MSLNSIYENFQIKYFNKLFSRTYTNGLYLVHESSWERHPDYASGQAFTHRYIPVLQGTDKGKLYTIKNEQYEIGTDPLEFFETALSSKKLPGKIIIRDKNGNFEGAGSSGSGGEEIPEPSVPKGFEEFFENGTFTVPEGVTELIITACGAGGGGAQGNGNSIGAGGGGAAAIVKQRFTVVPGTTIPITIGKTSTGTPVTGNGGVTVINGGSGGSTIIGYLITLPGGGGGTVWGVAGVSGGSGGGNGEADGINGTAGGTKAGSGGGGSLGGGGAGGSLDSNIAQGGSASLTFGTAGSGQGGNGGAKTLAGQNGAGPTGGTSGYGSLSGGGGGGGSPGGTHGGGGGQGGGGYVLIEWGEAA
jgi:hypothetical protein